MPFLGASSSICGTSPRRTGWSGFNGTVAYWKGFTAYIELATRDDVTQIYFDSKKFKTQPEVRTDGRSAIGAGRVLFHETKVTPRGRLIRPCSTCSGARRPAQPPFWPGGWAAAWRKP